VGSIHPQARALHIRLTVPVSCLNADGVVAEGYRVSGFVLWHEAGKFGDAEIQSAAGGSTDMPSRHRRVKN